MEHFVYRITVLNSPDERKYYVGKRSGSVNDFKDKKYFTNSKIIRKLLKNPETKFSVKIVKICKASKEALNFESKHHNRVNAAANLKFFNLQNQTSVHKSVWGDRTNLVSVIDNTTGKTINISSEMYKKNTDRFISLSSKKVSCINKNTGERLAVPLEEFHSNPDLEGVARGLINVIDTRTGITTRKN